MGEVRYLNDKDVAKITGLSTATLRRDRFLKQGIPYAKIGRACRYKLEDVVVFMDAHKVQTEARG